MDKFYHSSNGVQSVEAILSLFDRICDNMVIYLRNLLTHTVNILLQTLHNVKNIQYSVVKQKFNIIHIMCKKIRTIP